MALFEKIVGFKDKSERDIVVRLNPGRSWDEYSTVGEGLRFARRNPVSNFLVESWNYSCVEMLADMKISQEMVNLRIKVLLVFCKVTLNQCGLRSK